MTKFKKILFIVVIALLVITGALYIDFFFCKHRETHPRIAIKENIIGHNLSPLHTPANAIITKLHATPLRIPLTEYE